MMYKQNTEESLSLAQIISMAQSIDFDDNQKVVQVKILSNFNISGLDSCLKVDCHEYGIACDVSLGAYGQWQQEIINWSDRKEDDVDITFLLLDLWGVEHDFWFRHHAYTDEQLQETLMSIMDEYFVFIDTLLDKSKGKVVVGNGPIPSHIFSTAGASYNVARLNKYIHAMHAVLMDKYKGNDRIAHFDFDYWLGNIGKQSCWGDKYQYLGDFRLSPNSFTLLSAELLGFVSPMVPPVKKCIVLDLDNTLWGGIVGEDGLDGIKLTPHGIGQEFYEFQKLIKGMSETGIILAINSKNNMEDVRQVFQKHPHMLLSEDDFGAIYVNWKNKAENILSISRDLNIGTDSMVFVDDDPTNRELVSQAIEDVHVLDLPADPAKYVRTLLDYKGFSKYDITSEDRKRSEMYTHQRMRRDFQAQSVDMSSFLKSLDIQIKIHHNERSLLTRAAQLTQKTNQFNLTTRRYTKETLEQLISDDHHMWVLDVSDRFGDYGSVGVVLVENKLDIWHVDTVLLSCRVLGKNVEDQFFVYVLDSLKKLESKEIVGYYAPTQKNMQTEMFYDKFGFTKMSDSDEADIWKRGLDDYSFEPVEFIKIMDL